jgi:hypothetical protein
LLAVHFERHFHGLQFGVATPGGSEKLIHGIMDQQQADPSQDIIQLDSENAFNNLDRDSIFTEVKDFFPELLPYVLSIYNKPTNIFIHQDNGTVQFLKSTMGAYQGAPLGSMLYSAGQQGLLRNLQHQLEQVNGVKPYARAYHFS